MTFRIIFAYHCIQWLPHEFTLLVWALPAHGSNSEWALQGRYKVHKLIGARHHICEHALYDRPGHQRKNRDTLTSGSLFNDNTRSRQFSITPEVQ